MSFDEYLALKEGPSVTYSTAEATHWVTRNGVLYLFPEPSSAVSYTVYGYEGFDDWPTGTGNTEPDLPREFDEAICWYMLSRYYAGQEDLELVSLYDNMFETAVGRFVASQMRNDARSPRVLGGGLTRYGVGYDRWVRRMTEG
jgi:hypothetical protein